MVGAKCLDYKYRNLDWKKKYNFFHVEKQTIFNFEKLYLNIDNYYIESYCT
jgi:hypothetical protein